MGLTEHGAASLATAIRRGEVGAVEVVEAFAARIDTHDRPLNAVVVRCFDEAIEQARASERRVHSGEAVGPLEGVPVTVKEAIAVAGLPWTSGSRLSAGAVAPRDAGAVRRYRGAGAIVIGKTNVPEFCSWYDTDNDVYGRTRNPHAYERSPGGSSGGESAALAAGLSPLGLGSDLASSIRQPAAWTGVFGLKPSRGLVPVDGHRWFGASFGWRAFAVIGPMARCVDDIGLALEVLAGHPLTPAAAAPLRTAVFEDDGLQPISQVCRAAVRRAAAVLVDAGYEVDDAAAPSAAEVRAVFDQIVATELRLYASPNLAGRKSELSRYGRRAFEGLDRFVPDLQRYTDAGLRLAELEAEAEAWQERYPLALCPVVPVPAPLAADGLVDADGEPFRPGGKLTLCTWASALGLPALSVPCGADGSGLPLAVQVIGRRGCDGDVLEAARHLELALGGAVTPPDRSRHARAEGGSGSERA